MGTLQARPLSSVTGVEVSGADFTEPLGDDQAAQLKALFQEHRLVLFRGQELSDDDHMRLCNDLLPAHPQIGYMSNTEVKGFHPDFNLLFHSDFAFTRYPLLGISLYAVELDPDAAPTRFINTQAAYEAMPAGMKATFEQLDVHMLANTVEGREDRPARTVRLPADTPDDPRYIRIVRPTISQHRVTNTPFVLASEQQASHFEGVSLEESDQLLDELFGYMYADRFLYEHQWQQHDLVIWDNLTLQHGRRDNPNEVRRCLRRVTMNEVSMAELLEGTVYARATSTG